MQSRPLMTFCRQAFARRARKSNAAPKRVLSSQAAFKESGQIPYHPDDYDCEPTVYQGEIASDNSKVLRRYYYGDQGTFEYAQSYRPITSIMDALTHDTRTPDVLHIQVAGQTLDSLAKDFEALLPEHSCHVKQTKDALSVRLGSDNDRTFLILSQKESREMWLHTPDRRLARFEFINGKWTCAENGMSLPTTLSIYLSAQLSRTVQFQRCEQLCQLYSTCTS